MTNRSHGDETPIFDRVVREHGTNPVAHLESRGQRPQPRAAKSRATRRKNGGKR